MKIAMYRGYGRSSAKKKSRHSWLRSKSVKAACGAGRWKGKAKSFITCAAAHHTAKPKGSARSHRRAAVASHYLESLRDPYATIHKDPHDWMRLPWQKLGRMRHRRRRR